MHFLNLGKEGFMLYEINKWSELPEESYYLLQEALIIEYHLYLSFNTSHIDNCPGWKLLFLFPKYLLAGAILAA
jgi:hypothetical protein